MGGGSWTSSDYTSYAKKTRGVSCSVSAVTGLSFDGDDRVDQVFKSYSLHEDLNIKDKIRECCDTEEHPNTVPVILGLDVTGSMGNSAMECSKKLNVIMNTLLKEVTDVEFSIMAIGDTAYDRAPIQMSQFESDVRIAQAIDKIYFEGGGGPNEYESYSLAWYCGLNHAKLDCWNRGKRGIIITLGDEPLNPILFKDEIQRFCGGKVQSDFDTEELYREAVDKYDIYHIIIKDGRGYRYGGFDSWRKLLPEDHVIEANVSELDQVIPNIIKMSAATDTGIGTVTAPSTPFNGNVVKW